MPQRDPFVLVGELQWVINCHLCTLISFQTQDKMTQEVPVFHFCMEWNSEARISGNGKADEGSMQRNGHTCICMWVFNDSATDEKNSASHTEVQSNNEL
jgi:hypothetical protein